ncbi:MAG: Mpo1-like protein, partial [Pseudoxanthomonas sp.]
PIDRWFHSYSGDHRNDTNQLIHIFAVPAILWSVIALLWCIPAVGSTLQNGIWAALAMFAAWMFYNRLSRPIGYGMLLAFFTIGCSCRLIDHTYGTEALLYAGITVFVVAWIAQFIGHKIEGKKPSFFTDLVYLLIGPIWVLAKFYRKMEWKY